MRVTTIIKDYIAREVGKKYLEKLNSIPNDYQEDYDKMIDELSSFAKDCNEKAKDIVRKYDMLEDEKYEIINYRTYSLGNEERRQKRSQLEKELQTAKKDKIAQIILDLELGETTKKELAEVLSKVEF